MPPDTIYWTETRTYNSLLQLTAVTHNGVLDLYYTYSTQNNGRIQTSMQYITGQAEHSTNYFYDSLNRLIQVNADIGWGLNFTYDGFGNLTDKTPNSGSPPALHVTVNPVTNQIYTYTYDANGNLTNIPNQMALGYDAENRVTTVRPFSGGTETYGYTPDNKRVYRKEPNGTVVTYAYGVFGERLAAFDGTGKTLGRNVYFGSKLIATQNYNNGALSGMAVVTLDRVGSVREATSAFTYYPYGEEYAAATEDTEKFATYFRDSTSGLDYAQNRYYSSILGRFMTADPYRASGSSVNNPADPGSWNRYAYAGNDPENFNDPQGLYAFGGPETGCDVMVDDVCDPTDDPCAVVDGQNFFPGVGGNPCSSDGPLVRQPSSQICWTDTGRISQTLSDLGTNIEEIADSRIHNSAELSALTADIDQDITAETTQLANMVLTGPPTGPDYVGGHFNLIIPTAQLTSALGSVDYSIFRGAFGGKIFGTHQETVYGNAAQG